jgi:hypothetical protein
MGLSRLDNFLKNSRGDIIYVDPSSIDSTDSIENQGNSLVRPFKTIQRALIEAARFSYQRGLDNDRFGRTTIIVYPGEHLIDNRPGWIPIHDNPVAGNNWLTRGGAVSNEFPEFNLNSNFDINNDTNDLYKMNSVFGGIIIPRGTSIVGMDLRKTKIRAKFIPNPEDDTIDRTSIFRVTGSCYFYQFTFFDADPNSVVFKDYGPTKFVPNFSHHKLTCFEYADGVNPVIFDDQYITYKTTKTDLDLYYDKIALAYGSSSGRLISPDFPTDGVDVQTKIDEYRIVGSKGQNVGITSIKAGDGVVSSTTITVDIEEPIGGLDVDTPIRIEGVPTAGYNGQYVVSTSESPTRITYKTSSSPANPLPTIVSGTPTLNIVVDTVTSASPYIFNCSLRSVFGMCGLHADGSKADGFKSMVVAQFTGIGLQKDDNAFLKYNTTSGVYEDKTAVSNIHTNSSAVYKPEYENFHIKASNDAFLQLVSVFAIGYANHFLAESGGDHSITNSNSNFGAKSLVARGFKKEAFSRDDTGFITHIIPPQEIQSEDINVEYTSIDVETTVGIGSTTRLYLYNETDLDNPPLSVVDGYRIGSKINDELKVLLNINGQSTTKTSKIIMPNTQSTGIYESSSYKEAVVGRTNIGINSISSNTFTLTAPHQFIQGESLRVFSSDGELPDGLNHNQVYYAITAGINSDQIKLSQTFNDTITEDAVTVNNKGGILTIESRVSDKKSGDIGHPIQFDSNIGQWYLTVSGISSYNQIYSSVVGLGTTTLGRTTPRTFITRKSDTRSLIDKIYKVRYVIPKDSAVIARPPRDGFVIQESNTTIGATQEEIGKYNSVDAVILNNSSELRNYRFISNAVWDSVGIATLTTEVPHELSVGSLIQINNIKSGFNTTGVGNSGFNGEYFVTSKLSRREFTIGLTTNPGLFQSDTSIRDVELPYYKRVRFNNTFVVYKSEEIQQYVPNTKDGVYHLTIIDSSNSPSVEPFTQLRFSQPVKNLYPQLDRDNITSDPDPTVSFALPSPLGLVEVNNPENSVTRESIVKSINDFAVGFGLTDIQSATGFAHTLYTRIDHGLNRITRVGIVSAGENYGSGSGSIETLYNARLVGFAGSTTGNYATANIKVDALGRITDVRIVDGGSAYGIGNTLSVVGVGTTLGHIVGVVSVTQINNDIGNVISISGLYDKVFDTYNNLYRITGINVGQTNQIQVTSSSEVVAQYPFTGSTAIAGVNTNGLSKINATFLNTVESYVTGNSLGITSFTYNNSTGIASVTTLQSHGFVNGTKFKIGGFNQSLYNGDFITTKIVGLNDFEFNIGIGTTSPVSSGIAYIYIPGFAAQGGLLAADNEANSSRLVAQYAGITTTLDVALVDPTINTLTVTNALNRNWQAGDYIIVNKEIMRISETVVIDTAIDVFRGLFGTSKQVHPAGSVVRRVRFKPIEFRRNSILRASGHTFEYLGYGPGNYSTALPERQDRQFIDVERVLSQSVSDDGGTPIYNGLDDNGNTYTVNKLTNASTGQDLLTKAPIPTVRGEDITSNTQAVGFDVDSTDDLTVARGLKVEGGSESTIISEFNGPVIFTEKITSTSEDGILASSLFLQGESTTSRKYTVGIATPLLSGNAGDIVYKADPNGGVAVGWVYTLENSWQEFGPIKSVGTERYCGIFSGAFVGDGSGLDNVSDVWVFDGIGISTTRAVGMGTTTSVPSVALYVGGNAIFAGVTTIRTNQLTFDVPNGFLVNTGITTFNQQVNVNTLRAIGISTFQNDVIITTNPATTGDTAGNFLRFVQSDTAITSAYQYGGINWEGNDIGNTGVRGYIRGVAEGSTGQFAITFGTQQSGPSAPIEQLRIASDGNITASGEITALSDERYKTNVKNIDDPLAKVLQLRGVEYDRIDKEQHTIGLIAQEVEKVLPELVHENHEGVKSVAYQNMVALLIEAIKEQQKQISDLKEEVDKLKNV